MTGSHAAWAEGYAHYSAHSVQILGLEGRHWKWRMHGGAVSLAKRFLEDSFHPDIILASDMLDLTTFLALAGKDLGQAKTVVYFHENQIAYPWSENDPDTQLGRDAHYGFINYTSALAADAVAFNSRFHLDFFLWELERFLKGFPDHIELDTIQSIRNKSRVLQLGLDLGRLEECRPASSRNGPPLILWNHRWEYDKNPDEFFKVLFELQVEGLGFEVAILGEQFTRSPEVFADAKQALGEGIIQCGFAEDFGRYAELLWQADIMPVTSIHDFFGGSVVQGIYCNCYPLLPMRLAYPEHVPAERHGEFFYEDSGDLKKRLRERITDIEGTRRTVTSNFVRHYDWQTMAPMYDEYFLSL
jgi:glycosyltransferase involved in cell wall biosynthesis